jgi:NADH dehydrogenase
MTWLFIHIAFLTGYRNRFGAILTWWVAFTWDRRRERAFMTVRTDAPVVQHDNQ